MRSPRKFVVPAVMVALWVATVGLVPRSAEATTTALAHVTSVCNHRDAAPSHQPAFAAETERGKQRNNDGVDVDEDGPDVACCELVGHLPVAAPSLSNGEHRDSAYVRAHWVSLSARGPPQS